MLKRPNVDLVTDPIDAIVPEGIRTKDGKVWPADALMFATGFKVSKMLHPMNIVGRDGRELHEVWVPTTPEPISASPFPAFQLLHADGAEYGPCPGGNQIFMTECGVPHDAGLRELPQCWHRSIECRRDVYERYNREVDTMHARMMWTHKGMTNWYRNPHGHVFAITPWRWWSIGR